VKGYATRQPDAPDGGSGTCNSRFGTSAAPHQPDVRDFAALAEWQSNCKTDGVTLGNSTTTEEYSEKRHSILVVDDDAAIRELLTDMLSEHGYDVREAGDGAQAVREMRFNPADVVITDLVMPEKEGLETIQEIRHEFPGVKVIAISGYHSGAYLYHASVFGASAAIQKPFSLNVVLQVVGQMLSQA